MRVGHGREQGSFASRLGKPGMRADVEELLKVNALECERDLRLFALVRDLDVVEEPCAHALRGSQGAEVAQGCWRQQVGAGDDDVLDITYR